MASESSILAAIRARLASMKFLRLFRNNVGTLQDRDGRYVQYGLCPGSSDLIGWTSIVVTAAHLGKPIAVFTAVEVKSDHGRATAAQNNFIHQVRNAGGIAGIARTPDEASELICSQIPGIQSGPL